MPRCRRRRSHQHRMIHVENERETPPGDDDFSTRGRFHGLALVYRARFARSQESQPSIIRSASLFFAAMLSDPRSGVFRSRRKHAASNLRTSTFSRWRTQAYGDNRGSNAMSFVATYAGRQGALRSLSSNCVPKVFSPFQRFHRLFVGAICFSAGQQCRRDALEWWWSGRFIYPRKHMGARTPSPALVLNSMRHVAGVQRSCGCRVCRDRAERSTCGALSWRKKRATQRAGGLFRSPAAPRLRGWASPTGTWNRATGGSTPPTSRWAEPCGPRAAATGCSRRTGTSRTASGRPCSRSPR